MRRKTDFMAKKELQKWCAAIIALKSYAYSLSKC
jgi:hypothetical protein